MAQDALNHFFIRPQLIQIRRNSTSEPMPAIPLQSDGFNDWADDPLCQFVKIHVFTAPSMEYHTGGWVSHGNPIRIEDLCQLSNDGNGLCACGRLRFINDLFPNRPTNIQSIACVIQPLDSSQFTLSESRK